MSFLPNKDIYKVWVFAPYLETEDSTLKKYYDYTDSQREFTEVFNELDCEWEWVNITLNNLPKEISRVKSQKSKQNVVLNLCDGDEVNGTPGISATRRRSSIVSNSIMTPSKISITTAKLIMNCRLIY